MPKRTGRWTSVDMLGPDREERVCAGRVGSVFGKAGYLVACLAAAIVFVVSGYAHGLVGDTTALEGGANLGSNVPPTGAMNILLMGLESRTNFQGQNLSTAQLTQTHSGKVTAGTWARRTRTR